MAREIEKRFQEAERLFKQGRGDAATRDLRLLAEDSARDLLLLNRIGDFLVRHGQKQEALGVYARVAEEFFRSGLLPKAIAVLKKTLRIEPGHLQTLLLLADAYAKAQVLGEARSHLLGAADRFLKGGETDRTRLVYEKLVAIEPQEPLHRVRLAETRVLAGDNAGACEDLLAAAGEFMAQEKGSEAEKTYRRADELSPGRPEVLSGIARALALRGRIEDAIAFLEQAVRRPGIGPGVAGDLFFLYDQSGRTEQALAFLMDDRADALDDDAIERMVREHVRRGSVDQAWKRVDLVLERWVAAARHDRIATLLERLSWLEGQEIAALDRLHQVQKVTGDRAALTRTLERLVQAHWAESAHNRASAILEELKTVDPSSALVAESISRGRRLDAPAPVPPSPPAAPTIEAPAVPKPKALLAMPQTQADREFTAGHLTEAETFQKYGLASQAVAQVRQVIDRFPGHIVAHEKLVDLLRTSQDREGTRDALVALALARRSADDLTGALEAVRMAREMGALPPAALRDLERAGLTSARVAAVAAPEKAPAPADEDFEILFDDAEPVGAAEGILTAPTAKSRTQYPPAEAVEEILFFLSQGMKAEAARSIASLRKRGFGGNKLDDLERQASRSKLSVEELQKDSSIARLDGDELFRISGVLDADLGAEPEPPAEASAATEQSLDEVFRAFKDRVADEVGSQDFRTHYDLGIAYKEMGLLDDAIGEFTVASESADLFPEACAMLAMCHRERGDSGEAALWYRQALEARGGAGIDLQGIRYELGEVLAESGDVEGALEMFGQVFEANPSYREVARRLSELRSRDRS